jgi:hypothetical protein
MYTYLGGWSGVVWSIAVPMVITWHSTFLVNSAAHVYGRRPYETGTPAAIVHLSKVSDSPQQPCFTICFRGSFVAVIDLTAPVSVRVY